MLLGTPTGRILLGHLLFDGFNTAHTRMLAAVNPFLARFLHVSQEHKQQRHVISSQ